MEKQFWLKHRDEPWYKVTKAEYVQAERQLGFHNTMGQPTEPATAAFGSSSDGIRGTTFLPPDLI